jgi:hypothetical protein
MRPLPPARVAALEAEIESLELLVDLRALVDLLMF